jgi:hypothetical protein
MVATTSGGSGETEAVLAMIRPIVATDPDRAKKLAEALIVAWPAFVKPQPRYDEYGYGGGLLARAAALALATGASFAAGAGALGGRGVCHHHSGRNAGHGGLGFGNDCLGLGAGGCLGLRAAGAGFRAAGSSLLFVGLDLGLYCSLGFSLGLGALGAAAAAFALGC